MCRCTQGVEIGNYKNQVVLRLPKHYKGQKRWVGIDQCIADEIIELWSKGIITYGSCCGHNQLRGTVLVHDKDIPLMHELGYEWFKNSDGRMEIFYTKSNYKQQSHE